MSASSDKAVAVIVGAGEGTRMRTQTRKQYLMLGDRPVLAHTLSVFEACEVIEEIFLVIPEGDDLLCQKEIVDPLRPSKPIHLLSGGVTRQESVYRGLKAIDANCSLAVIHDGVRPLVKTDKIAECVRVAKHYGGCILSLTASDTIKSVDENDLVVSTLKRDMIRMAQTPQAFDHGIILRAHVAAQEESYLGNDDAELVERTGEAVKVIQGDPYNIKITTPEDLRLAEALLAQV